MSNLSGAYGEAINVEVAALLMNDFDKLDHEQHNLWQFLQDSAEKTENEIQKALEEDPVPDENATTVAGYRADVAAECLVCGLRYASGDMPWGPTGERPSGHKCICCGAIFGADDVDLGTMRRFRHQWVGHGAPWIDPSTRPAEWNFHALVAQMRSLPLRAQ